MVESNVVVVVTADAMTLAAAATGEVLVVVALLLLLEVLLFTGTNLRRFRLGGGGINDDADVEPLGVKAVGSFSSVVITSRGSAVRGTDRTWCVSTSASGTHSSGRLQEQQSIWRVVSNSRTMSNTQQQESVARNLQIFRFPVE